VIKCNCKELDDDLILEGWTCYECYENRGASNWNWTPKARRLGSNLIALTCLMASAGMIVLMFYKITE
jgi:hypothetical protein